MSLPSFPSSPPVSSPSAGHGQISITGSRGPGAGNLLPKALLIVCGVCSLIATIVSVWSIILQLKGYRRPNLQRHVVRIMIMVPLYAIASFIALFSLDAAFFIDTVRDLYEAFVIYEFLQLLITYLGGERSLLIILHGRPPIPHPFPVNIFCKPMDVSDPWVLLNLKRGVLQYVQVKPLLVLATVTLKATDTYREGELSFKAGYTYVSFFYNTSICLSLYCLAMFWVAVNKDLQSFRPLPKFLCVKGILFFSFWQGLGVSFLVAVHAIKRVGAYTDAEHMSLALTDSLVCLEMPFFAIAHQYAFQASDYIDDRLQYCARLPFFYAFKDAFGGKDVWMDSKATLKGQGISYQAYEPAEGGLHVGEGRRKRIRAGLRYTSGGQQKYWVAQPGDDARATGEHGPLTSIKRKLDDRRAYREGYAPLLPHHTRRSTQDKIDRPIEDSSSDESDAPSLDFNDEGPNDSWEESMYSRARKVQYFGYPNVDVSKEKAKRKQWEEEQGVLEGRWSARQGDGSARGRERKNGKGKAEGKKGVYGKWAEQSKAGGSNDGASQPSSQQSDDMDTPQGDQMEAWLFDGENERSDAWRPPQEIENALSNTLKWTGFRKEHNASPKPADTLDKMVANHHHLTPSTSPFEIGSADETEDPAEEDHVTISERPLPSDAVDLVIDDREAVSEAQNHERRKGEPATHAPKHIYRRGFLSPNDGSSSSGRTSPVRQRSPSPLPGSDHQSGAHPELRNKVQGGVNTIEVGASSVEEVSPPKIISDLTEEVGENPWR